MGGLRARAELESEQAKLRFVAPLAPPVHHGKGLRLSHPPIAEALHRTGVWCGSGRSCRRSRSWSRTKQGEASPHKRRLKCVTNISPRRLMTHLLHQMDHYRTTLRGSEQRSATIARITIHTRNDIEYKKKVIRVLRHVVSPAGDPNSTGKAGCRTVPLLNIVGYKV